MTLFGTLIGLHGSGGMHLGTSDFGFTQPSDPQMELASFRRLSLPLHMGTKRRDTPFGNAGLPVGCPSIELNGR